MGKGSAPSQPAAPDPAKTAAAQGAANKEAAIASAELNMVNQNSPYGTVNYNQSGTSAAGTPQYTQTTTLAPSQQRQLDLTNQVSEGALGLGQSEISHIADATKNPFTLDNMPAAGQYSTSQFPPLQSSINTSGMPNYQTSANGGPIQTSLDYSGAPQMMDTSQMDAARQRIEGNLFDRLNPQLDRQQNMMENKLANQGIQLGSEAWRNAQDDQGRTANDLRLAADTQAGNEVNNEFNQSLAGRQQAIGEINNQGNFANTAQGQAFSQSGQNAQLNNSVRDALFGQNLQQAQFGNTARDQASNEALTGANFANQTRQNAISEAALQRSQPINELAALLGTSGGVQQPGGANGSGVAIQPGDIQGQTNLAYQNQLSAYNNANQQRQSGIGNIFGLAGTLSAPYSFSM